MWKMAGYTEKYYYTLVHKFFFFMITAYMKFLGGMWAAFGPLD